MARKAVLIFLLGCVLSFASGGAAHYFYNLHDFKARTGVELSELYGAQEKCNMMTGEDCAIVGTFYPKSYFD